jgi:tRNA pseudouridine(38-40) synthase
VTVPRRVKQVLCHPGLILRIAQRRPLVYRNVGLRSCSVSVGQGARACKCQCVVIGTIISEKMAPFLTVLCSQPDTRTIEGVLFDALVRVGAVSADNADDPTKVGLGRAARTDAGVHAGGNLVSLKLITQIPGIPDVVAAVNRLLPSEIRVWGIIRVQNSFNARTYVAWSLKCIHHSLPRGYRSCDSRKYTFCFPSYLLLPPKPGSGLYETLRRQTVPLSSSSSSVGALTDNMHAFWAESPPEASKEDDLQRKRQWRAEPDTIQRLREAARKFEGTRNFHNFTVGREFSDRSTQRHMKKIEVSCFLRVLAATEEEGRYLIQLSMAAQSGLASCSTARVSCSIR